MRAAERDGSHAKLRAGDRGSSLGVNLGLLPASTASFVLPSRGQALCHSEASPPPRVFISSRPKRALDGSQWHKRLPLWKRVDGQQRHIRGRQGVPTEAPLGRSCLARPVFQAAISKQPPPPHRHSFILENLDTTRTSFQKEFFIPLPGSYGHPLKKKTTPPSTKLLNTDQG